MPQGWIFRSEEHPREVQLVMQTDGSAGMAQVRRFTGRQSRTRPGVASLIVLSVRGMWMNCL